MFRPLSSMAWSTNYQWSGGEVRLWCELYAEGLLCEFREGGAFSVRHRRQQHVNQKTAFMGQGWPLKIRRNVYCCNVKIPSQENEVLRDLGARKRNHLQFFEPFLFSPYCNRNVSLGNYLNTLKFEFLGELNLLAFVTLPDQRRDLLKWLEKYQWTTHES